ncbi:Trafficking protein particle complex subunit 33, partial [Ascosphaera aggregata]
MSFETPASPSTGTASDSYTRLLSTASLDFLLMEIVPLAERIVDEQGAKNYGRAGGGGDEDDDDTAVARGVAKLEDDERRESTYYRLEGLGFRVGQGLAERFSRDRPRFADHLDVIKFLCKDLWTILFQKQIDNLKTNHR